MNNNTFAAVFNTNTNTFGHQPNKAELQNWCVPDSTPAQLAQLNTAYQAALNAAQGQKKAGKIKVCKQLHNGPFGAVHVFTESEDGVISPGQVLANELGIAYDRNGDLIDLG